MDEISQLGHVPTQANTASAKEKNLANRLRYARKADSLTKEQEAALDKLAQTGVTNLMQQVRDLGHYPKESRRGCAEHWRWPWCGGLQELMVEISQLGHVPTQANTASAKEKNLAKRLRYARKADSLTREQEAALDKLAQASVTKVVRGVCAQGGDAGSGMRRRPAARNAEEDRRLSRRTDAV